MSARDMIDETKKISRQRWIAERNSTPTPRPDIDLAAGEILSSEENLSLTRMRVVAVGRPDRRERGVLWP